MLGTTAHEVSARLGAALTGFRPTTPDLLARRELLQRFDSKYVVPQQTLESLLASLHGEYAVLRSGDIAFARYRTLYFDTPELRCFHDHQRGSRPYHKVRIRHYDDRFCSFLEVKSKGTDEITRKYRLEVPYGLEALGPTETAFIGAHTDLPTEGLEPQAWIHFRRLTLVGVRTHERVTIDVGLEVGRERLQSLDGLVIVEVKRCPTDADSPVLCALSAAGLAPQKASKYCTAMTMLNAQAHPGTLSSRLFAA